MKNAVICLIVLCCVFLFSASGFAEYITCQPASHCVIDPTSAEVSDVLFSADVSRFQQSSPAGLTFIPFASRFMVLSEIAHDEAMLIHHPPQPLCLFFHHPAPDNTLDKQNNDVCSGDTLVIRDNTPVAVRHIMRPFGVVPDAFLSEQWEAEPIYRDWMPAKHRSEVAGIAAVSEPDTGLIMLLGCGMVMIFPRGKRWLARNLRR